MSADTADVERYSQMEMVIRGQNERIAELEKGERVARYAHLFGKLEMEGWPIDAAEEVVRCQDYTQEQVQYHIENDIKKYGAQSQLPIGPGVRPDRSPHPMHQRNDADRPLTAEEYDKGMKHMQENPGVGFTEAIKYAMNGAPVRG